jgi:hypothetical protein
MRAEGEGRRRERVKGIACQGWRIGQGVVRPTAGRVVWKSGVFEPFLVNNPKHKMNVRSIL